MGLFIVILLIIHMKISYWWIVFALALDVIEGCIKEENRLKAVKKALEERDYLKIRF